MPQSKNDKILTIAISVLSVAGLLYFGLSAIFNDSRKSSNPFEYNIEFYEQSGAEQLGYEQRTALSLPLEHPHALAVDSKDRLFVTGGAEIYIFSQTGETLSSGTASAAIHALSIDSNGSIFLALEKSVEVLDSTFKRIAQWEIPGERSLLTSIAVSQNAVFCADAGERVVWHFDKNGTRQNKVGEKDDSKDVPGFVIPSPYFDVLVDSDGFLWAINTGRHQFENYFPDGALRSSWQKSSMQVDGFSGCCNPVHVALLPDGSFVTSEKGILRIKVHNRIGELVEVVALPDQFDKNVNDLDIAVNSTGDILVLDPVQKQVRIFQKKDKAS
jgi:hypothetical protein